MKKILYPLFMALALGFSFAACDDDDDDGGAGFANTPEICSGDVTFNATSVANISHDNGGFVFFNTSSSNGLGSSFTGRIDGAGIVESSFDQRVRSGRVTYTYHYKFIGRKQ